jgi:hypothetical protein
VASNVFATEPTGTRLSDDVGRRRKHVARTLRSRGEGDILLQRNGGPAGDL